MDDTHPLRERTCVIIKPDGVKLGATGEILHRFEKAGLKIVALKMVQPTPEHMDKHYQESPEWLEGLGEKTYATFDQFGWNVGEVMGTTDKTEIGKMVKKWLVEYFTEAPVVATVLEGMHAVTTVRKLVGNTIPIKAEPGTIRGDFSTDSNSAANMEKRAVRNVIHASGNIEEANFEIEHWFSPEEIHEYTRASESAMFRA